MSIPGKLAKQEIAPADLKIVVLYIYTSMDVLWVIEQGMDLRDLIIAELINTHV